MRAVTICVEGLPPEVSTNIYVDGKPVGSLQDSGCRRFVISKKEGHTFCVDEEVKGASYTYEGITVSTRYKCAGKCWSVEPVEKERVCEYIPVCTYVWVCNCICGWDYVCYMSYQCHYEEKVVGEQSYTFKYYAEHQIGVNNPHGDNFVEWAKEGTSVSLYAQEVVSLVDEKRVKERDVFQYWSVNGRPNKSNAITLLVDRPYVAKAYYEKEEEYKIRVYSDYGHPAMDEASGWYMKGEEATISIEPEVPLEGWKGAWGGKRVFAGWFSEEGLESRNPTYTFEVESAKDFRAEWTIDDSKPMMYLYILIAVIVAAAVALTIFFLYWTGRIPRRKEGAEPPQETKEKPKPKRGKISS
jgi:hypothetical protein